MSHDKSALKREIFRRHFRPAINLIANEYDALPVHDSTLRYVIEDASVRMAGMPSLGQTGRQFYERYTQAIDRAFSTCPSLHTYVLVFDKRHFIPPLKLDVQGTHRRQNVQRQAEQLPDWSYDEQCPIIAFDTTVPPWPRVRRDPRAYQRAHYDLVGLLCAHYRPPPGKRLLIDYYHQSSGTSARWLEHTRWTFVPPAPMSIVTTAADQCRHDAVPDWRLSNSCGEADLCAQLYAQWAHDPHSALNCEADAGSVAMRSCDTDFIVYSLMHRPAHNIYVCMGSAHLNSAAEFCSSTAYDAQMHWEIFDIHRMISGIGDVATVRSFVAFCILCGNDFIKKLGGVSRSTMYDVYKTSRFECRDDWTLDRRSFQAFMTALQQRSKRLKRHVSDEQLISQVEWCLHYARNGITAVTSIKDYRLCW